MKIDLPSGGWASLRDPEDVPERLRRPVVKLTKKLMIDPDIKMRSGMTASEVTEEQFDLLEEINDLLIVAMVDEWSYEAPVGVESARDLPARDYDTLREATARHVAGLFPDFTPDANPESPTSP